MSFLVSVIIPAYNVESFIEKAILSALDQEEVEEVIVVDDGSTDNTVSVIKNLQENNLKIKLFFHPYHINKGRSATRNLGIQKALWDYVAFLDADDFYLENRFKRDKEIFKNDLTIEGAYNSVGFEYYRSISDAGGLSWKDNTLSQQVRPEKLFEALISSKYGYLHLNGLTVKRTVFEKVGFFNEKLKVTQDSDMIYKLSLKCKLISSTITTPTAKRGIHNNNIFDKKEIYIKYNPILYEEVINWCLKNNITFYNIDLILKYYWIVRYREHNTLLNEIIYWLGYLVRNPKILFSKYSIKYFPIIRQRQILFPFLYKKRQKIES